jgi:butyryl-CoA dehydrogenase
MFHMMNEARIGVGSGATALGYSGYLKSLDYARNRPQGRPVTARTPPRRRCRSCSTPTCADAARAEVLRRGRARAQPVLRRLLDDERTARPRQDRARSTLLLDVLTPIAKSWPSQWCLEANSLAIQVLGGYGYTASTPSSSSTATTGSTRSTRGPTASRAWTCSAARSSCRAARGPALLACRIGATSRRATDGGASWPSWPQRMQAAEPDRGRRGVTGALFARGDVDVALANASV